MNTTDVEHDPPMIAPPVRETPVDLIPEIAAGARAAQPAWAARPVAERAELLEAAAARLEPQAEEIATLLTSESGKPIAQAEFEVRGAIGLLRANAQIGRRVGGEVLPMEGQRGTESDLAFTRREPLGLVAAILPFNFPIELYVEKCAAALVGGNAVIAKAPPETPGVVERFHRELIGAGVSEKVAVLVQGGADVGAGLAHAPAVDAISLTGSTLAGVAVAQAAAPRLRRLHLELGGNNAALVLADADLDLVASELAYGRLLMNGQACSASKRIVVDRAVHDELLEQLAAVVAEQILGSPLERTTTIGPLITSAAAERVADQVHTAQIQGAELIAGKAESEERWFAPALLARVPADAQVAVDDEIFGPVFTLIPVDGPAEALRVANQSSFGLMASVFTRDVRRALALAERLQAGGVVINGTDNYRPPVIPFGGISLSGEGREGAGYTLRELTREKTIVLRRFRVLGQELP